MPVKDADLIETLPLHAALDDALFNRFRELIYREAGIALTDMKKALLVGRLAGRLRELGLTTLASYYAVVSDPAAVDERRRMLNQIYNETSFFRDARHFEFLDAHVATPRSTAAASKRARVGSAAGCGVLDRRGAVLARHGAAARVSARVRLAAVEIHVTATVSPPSAARPRGRALARLPKAGTSRRRYRTAFMLRGPAVGWAR